MIFEKNIPIPPRMRLLGRTYALDEMEVGDSFLIPFADYKSVSSARSVCSNVTARYRREKGFNFTSRKVEGGFRVWRTE